MVNAILKKQQRKAFAYAMMGFQATFVKKSHALRIAQVMEYAMMEFADVSQSMKELIAV